MVETSQKTYLSKKRKIPNKKDKNNNKKIITVMDLLYQCLFPTENLKSLLRNNALLKV